MIISDGLSTTTAEEHLENRTFNKEPPAQFFEEVNQAMTWIQFFWLTFVVCCYRHE